MKISVMVQFHSEAEFMPMWFENIEPFADEIICGVDNSGDGCKEYVSKLKTSVPLRIVEVDNDIVINNGFAFLRNSLLQHVTGDWIISLDADEVLEATREDIIEATIGNHIAVEMTRYTIKPEIKESWSLFDLRQVQHEAEWLIDPQIRIFRNGEGIRWKGLIHEELFLPDGRNVSTNSKRSGLSIYHYADLVNRPRQHRKTLQAAELILRLVENPSLQEGTNAWWYTEFYENNKEMLYRQRNKFRELNKQQDDS